MFGLSKNVYRNSEKIFFQHLKRFQSTTTLKYDVVKSRDSSIKITKTCLILHGILGSGRNWSTFSSKMSEKYPHIQFILADLRNHGKSSGFLPPHTVEQCAQDVLDLEKQISTRFDIICGHSFGGKVAIKLLDSIPKSTDLNPRQVWIFDSTPFPLKLENSTYKLLTFARSMKHPFSSRKDFREQIMSQGFSEGIAQWMEMNLSPTSSLPTQFIWRCDLNNIHEMYISATTINLINSLKFCYEKNISTHFVFGDKTETIPKSDINQIKQFTDLYPNRNEIQLHILPNAGHWIHVDNLSGLIQMFENSCLK
eukprot:c2722_g1_i1.p1 GENE.c2722_g1_i1~~c2722_g1_i1.p1  ORF type:complete len:310 (+),score=124.70 c2722_g1_i1:36-965(+)